MDVQVGGEDSRPAASQAKPPQRRACATCARLKMKCRWPDTINEVTQNSCLRRMKIDCSVPASQSRRKRGKGTRVAQLEQKIDGLVSLLYAGQHIQAQGQSTLTPDSLPSSLTNRPLSPFQSNSDPGTQSNFSPIPPPLVVDDQRVAFELVSGFKLSVSQAQRYLDIFRRNYMLNFAFVIFDDQLTADELYAMDVCLFWTVMNTVAPLSAELQTLVKTQTRAFISERIVVKREKSLHLLQAILIYLAWSEWHLFFESQATPLLQLAQSLVIDLKLDKSVKSTYLPPKTLLGDAWESFKQPNTKIRGELSISEKRALLGTYHISSLIAALYRRGARPTWTSHYSQCRDDLYNSSERSDVLSASYVDLQRILDRALTAMPTYLGSDAAFSAPLEMFLSNTERELTDAVARFPDYIKSSKHLQMVYYIHLLRLYEPVIAMQPPIRNQTSTSPRTDVLFKSLQHAKSFFEVYLSLEPRELNFLATTTLPLHAFANYSVSRLLICDATTDWDPVIARRGTDFNSILKRSGEQFDKADIVAQEQGWKRRVLDDRTIIAFEKFARKLRWIADWYLKRINPEDSDREADPTQFDVSLGAIPDGLVDGAFESGWIDLMSFQDAGLFENFNFDTF